ARSHDVFLLSMTLQPPRSTLFPYTTLFRSHGYGYKTRKFHRRAICCGSGLGVAYKRKPCQFTRADWFANISHKIFLLNLFECNIDRKSTRLNSSHVKISYAVFCLKKKKDNR